MGPLGTQLLHLLQDLKVCLDLGGGEGAVSPSLPLFPVPFLSPDAISTMSGRRHGHPVL